MAIDKPSRTEFKRIYLDENMSLNDIADKYFISTATVLAWVKYFEASRKGKFISEDKLKKLFYSGLNSQEISKKLGCCEQTVKVYIKKYELEYSINYTRAVTGGIPKQTFVYGEVK